MNLLSEHDNGAVLQKTLIHPTPPPCAYWSSKRDNLGKLNYFLYLVAMCLYNDHTAFLWSRRSFVDEPYSQTLIENACESERESDAEGPVSAADCVAWGGGPVAAWCVGGVLIALQSFIYQGVIPPPHCWKTGKKYPLMLSGIINNCALQHAESREVTQTYFDCGTKQFYPWMIKCWIYR